MEVLWGYKTRPLKSFNGIVCSLGYSEQHWINLFEKFSSGRQFCFHVNLIINSKMFQTKTWWVLIIHQVWIVRFYNGALEVVIKCLQTFLLEISIDYHFIYFRPFSLWLSVFKYMFCWDDVKLNGNDII